MILEKGTVLMGKDATFGKLYLTIQEAAKLSSLSVKTLRRAISRGCLRKASVNVRRVLVTPDSLREFLDGGEARTV